MPSGTGTGAPEERKRIISPGFTRPSELERDIIYVTFFSKSHPKELSAEVFYATVESDYKFKLTSSAKLLHSLPTPKGSRLVMLCSSDKKARAHDAYFREVYEKFINNLAKNNAGQINYSRMIYEGVESTRTLDNILDMMLRIGHEAICKEGSSK